MKSLFKNILDYAKQYPFTFLAIILSTLIGILTFIVTFDVWRPTVFSLLGILPIFMFMLGAFVWQKLFKDKHKVVQGIFLLLINSTFLVCQSIYGLIIADLGATYAASRPLNNYKRYAEVIKSNDEYLKDVFPPEIPKDAKNIRMSGSMSPPIAIYFQKNIALSFDATQEYIDNEINRFNKIKPYKINRYDKLKEAFPLKHMGEGNYYVYSIIQKAEHPDENHENSFRGGCLINKDNNRVVYYYEKIYGDYCEGCYKKDNNRSHIDLRNYVK